MVTHCQPLAIRTLELTCFRNYSQLQLQFEPGIQLVTGKNGTGKTNLLEAIYLQSVTRSFRTSSDKNIVQHEQRFFIDTGIWQLADEEMTVSCQWMLGRGKKILWNHVPVSRLSSHIGKLPVVIVLPEDVEMIREGGAERRKWMDLLLSQADPDYLLEWIQYERFLEQRNALLKQLLEGKILEKSELALWTTQLIRSGRVLHQKRKQFLESFQPVFQEQYKQISAGNETPGFTLKTTFQENTAEEWNLQFERLYSAERSLGRTMAGVHREDLEWELNGKPVRYFASQGQSKTFLLALRLAQFYFLANQTGKIPVLLLDDVFDKLDQSRMEQIARLLDPIPAQIFITDTDIDRMKRHFHGASVHSIVCPI